MKYFTKALLPFLLMLCWKTGVAQVSANFSVNTIQGCAPLLVEFTDQSTATVGEIVTWQWDFGNGEISPNQNPQMEYTLAGQYTITLTVFNDLGQSDMVQVTNFITVHEPATVFAGDDETICNGDEITLTAVGTGDFVWSTGDETQSITVSPNSNTVYSVTIFNATGCQATDEVAVFVNPSPNVEIEEGELILACSGELVMLTATGTDYVVWDVGSFETTVFVSETGQYTVVGLNEFTCFDSDTIEVEFGSPPDIVANANQTICFGESAFLQVSGGSNYTWSTGDSGNVIEVSPTSTTTYFVEGENEYGCVNVTETTVFVNNPTPIDAGNSESICNGEITTLTVTGADGPFLWNTGQTEASIDVAPENNTLFTVQYTNEFGCVSTDEVTVFVGDQPVVDAGDDASICQGETYTIVPSGADLYQWDDGSFSDTYEVSIGGVYSVTGYNTFGCSDTDYIQVLVNNNPNLGIGIVEVCPDQIPYTFYAPPTATVVSWHDGSTGDSIVLTNPGAYSLTIANEEGCETTDNFDFIIFDVEEPNIFSTDFIINYPDYDFIVHCGDENFMLSTNANGADYTWSFGGNTSPQNITPEPNTKLVVWSQVISDDGCVARDSLIVYNDENCVWPGDTDYDGFVNNFDIFNIGIAYDSTSIYPRFNASTDWFAQPAVHWPGEYVSGVNYKHADTNGDAIIDLFDVEAIQLNYDLSHEKGETEVTYTDGPTLYVEFSVDTLNFSETNNAVTANIYLGVDDDIAENVYGVAFTMEFPGLLVEEDGVVANYTNSWLNENNGNMLTIEHVYEAEGQIDIGMVRTNQNNISGVGFLAATEFVLIDNVEGKNSFEPLFDFEVEISDVRIISFEEDLLPFVNNSYAKVYVETSFKPVVAPLSTLGLAVTPNPAKNSVSLQTQNLNTPSVIKIFNVAGMPIETLELNPNQPFRYSTANLNSGIYMLTLTTNERTYTSKFCITK